MAIVTLSAVEYDERLPWYLSYIRYNFLLNPMAIVTLSAVEYDERLPWQLIQGKLKLKSWAVIKLKVETSPELISSLSVEIIWWTQKVNNAKF